MRKATLDLNEFRNKNRTEEELVGFFNKWETIPSINLWLKARKFDLASPILVTQEKNLVITFYQTGEDRTIVLVHPNPKILEQLTVALVEPGRIVRAFSRVKDANDCIKQLVISNAAISSIIVPEKLQVSHNVSYKAFLNTKFPAYKVITIDKKNYRDSINLRTFKSEI